MGSPTKVRAPREVYGGRSGDRWVRDPDAAIQTDREQVGRRARAVLPRARDHVLFGRRRSYPGREVAGGRRRDLRARSPRAGQLRSVVLDGDGAACYYGAAAHSPVAPRRLARDGPDAAWH